MAGEMGWDGAFHQVRVWELQRGYGNQGITGVPKAQINHDAPVLCTDFSADGSKVFSGGASKQASEEYCNSLSLRVYLFISSVHVSCWLPTELVRQAVGAVSSRT